MEEIRYTNKSGEVRYYSTHHSAWRAAIRLNETETAGTWYFEGDSNGWYLHLVKDGE